MLEQLKQIGLTRGEIKVYEALLELGESTKTPIANASGISQGKIYEVLERLIKKGLVSTIKKSSVKHYRVANPKQLKRYIQNKKEEVQKEEKIVENILPELLTKFGSLKEDTDAEVYKGWKGMQTAYDEIIDTLKKGETDYVFGATGSTNTEQSINFFSRFNQKRYKKGIKLKIIYSTKDKEIAKQYITNKKLDTIKYLDLQTPAEVNIYKNKVIITILAETPLCILITSQKAADSFMKYFAELWKIAK